MSQSNKFDFSEIPPYVPRLSSWGTKQTETTVIRKSKAFTNPPGSLSPFTVFPEKGGHQIVNGIVVGTVIPYLTLDVGKLGTDLGLGAGKKVWLEVVINSDFSNGACTIETGSSWPAYATYSSSSPYVQTKATCRIGMVANGKLPKGTPGFTFSKNGNTYHFLQQLVTNLSMTACAIDGKATMLPLPFAG